MCKKKRGGGLEGLTSCSVGTVYLKFVVCVQMKVHPAASQFIGVLHLAVALLAVDLVPPRPHANLQCLLMEQLPVHVHALQQDLSVQLVGHPLGNATVICLCKL